MSQENVELVRSGYAAPEPLSIFAERIAPDVEFDFTAVYPDRPVFRGPDAVRRFVDTGGPWGGAIHFEPERGVSLPARARRRRSYTARTSPARCAYLTVSVPSIPACRWPATEQ